MNPLKKVLSLCLGLIILATTAVLISTGSLGAQTAHLNLFASPPPPSIPVNVTNTPLPVTGNVNANITNGSVPVSGTVAVSSLPPVTLNGASSVSVSNTSAAPLFVDNGYTARTAIGAECDAQFDSSGQVNCSLATVPAGHTLVIETITCAASVATGSPIVPILLNMGGPPIGGGSPISLNHRLLLTKATSIGSLDYYGLTTPVKMYAAATAGGSTGVSVSMQVGPSTANQGDGTCAISGYLVTQ